MAFELFRKHKMRNFPENRIGISKHGITFGPKIVELFNHDYIEVYLDRKNNRVGFKATESPISGFKLQVKASNTNTRRISAREIIRLVPGCKIYEVKQENDMVIIKVDKIRKQIAIEDTMKKQT